MTEVKAAPEAASQASSTDTSAKPKRNYSKRWKSIQKFERGTAKSARRIAEAITTGVNVWIEERDQSASKRKDGAIKDARKNFRKALRKSIRKASKAPVDIIEAFASAGTPTFMKLGRRWI